MKKIVFFVHCFFPQHFYGTEVYTLELAKNLQAFGHEVVVVTAIFPGEPQADELLTRYEWDGVPVYCIDKNRMPPQSIRETYYQEAMRDLLRDLLVEIKPDIVHVTQLTNHTAVLPEVAQELGLPVVATFTDFYGICYNNKLEGADGGLCQGPNPRRSNCVACLLKTDTSVRRKTAFKKRLAQPPWSFWYASYLCGKCRWPFVKQTRLLNMVRDVVVRPQSLAKSYMHYRAAIAPTTFLRDAYQRNGIAVPLELMHFGIDVPRHPKPARSAGEPLRIGFIGQLEPHKGLDLLLGAYLTLPLGVAQLQIYGSGDEGSPFLRQARKTAAREDIRFLGTFPKERIATILDDLDFLVIPSRWYENSPLVLLNALASHTPVIVSDVPGMTEFVKHGINGFVVERGSRDDLAATFAHIMRNRDVALAMTNTTEYPRTTRDMALDVLAFYSKAGITLDEGERA